MATALDIIKRSMRLLGVYSIGEDPSAQEAQDCLSAMNAMLDSWATENLFIYVKTTEIIPLASGVSSITVGPSGSFTTARPTFVDASSYVTMDGVSYPIQVWGPQDYNQIAVKGIQGLPCGVYVQMGFPDITMTFWPVPYNPMSFVMVSNKQVKSFPDLVTDVDLPTGYERLLAYSLAEEIAPEFDGVQVPPEVIKKAAQARKNIKRANVQVPLMNMPYGIPNNNGYVDWRSM